MKQEQERFELTKRRTGFHITKEHLVEKLKPAYEHYIFLKNKLKELEPTVKLHDIAEKEKTNLEQFIDNERRSLESETNKLTEEKQVELEKIEREEKSIKELSVLEEKELNLKKSISELPTLREKSANIEYLISKNRAEELTMEEQISKKQKEIENIISIGEGAPCPTCRQKMSLSHISKVKAEFDQEKLGVGEHIGYLNSSTATYEDKKREYKILIDNLESKEEYLKTIQREYR